MLLFEAFVSRVPGIVVFELEAAFLLRYRLSFCCLSFVDRKDLNNEIVQVLGATSDCRYR